MPYLYVLFFFCVCFPYSTFATLQSQPLRFICCQVNMKSCRSTNMKKLLACHTAAPLRLLHPSPSYSHALAFCRRVLLSLFYCDFFGFFCACNSFGTLPQEIPIYLLFQFQLICVHTHTHTRLHFVCNNVFVCCSFDF